MRLDVSVNLLTMHALSKGKITVFGGKQVRPNIHIDDIADLYIHLIEHPEYIGIFNAGFENISILDIAKLVTKYLPVEIEITESNDPRSYRINSDRILATGFKPKRGVEIAIQEIIEKYNSGVLKDNEEFYNLKWMQSHQLSD
jgi:nucleoside-diphosphate-sugar epimerase